MDATTRAATAAAIAYIDAGEHELKGKAEPVRLYQATRVVAASAGSQRSSVLEAPFTGRDHELRLVKELFHASAERSSARLVLVSGVAGVGKSRLAWEFFKYIDGLAGEVLWHSGRCLSYGEGVSYWALSEMVRGRLQIGEEDPLEVVAEKLTSGLERWIPDASDREFIFPRLAQLLGLSSMQSLAREELFSGWRLFFERLAEHLPVVMARRGPAVGRLRHAGLPRPPARLVRRPRYFPARPHHGRRGRASAASASAGGTSRRFRSSPFRTSRSASSSTVSSPTCRVAARRIVERAEGIPLYAIETVRGLLDGASVEKGKDGVLHLVGETRRPSRSRPASRPSSPRAWMLSHPTSAAS